MEKYIWSYWRCVPLLGIILEKEVIEYEQESWCFSRSIKQKDFVRLTSDLFNNRMEELKISGVNDAKFRWFKTIYHDTYGHERNCWSLPSSIWPMSNF